MVTTRWRRCERLLLLLGEGGLSGPPLRGRTRRRRNARKAASEWSRLGLAEAARWASLQLAAWSWSSLGRPEADVAPGRVVGDVSVPDRIVPGRRHPQDYRTRVLDEA
jgi:hypothetical protein